MNSTSSDSPAQWGKNDLENVRLEAIKNGKDLKDLKADIQLRIDSGQLKLSQKAQKDFKKLTNTRRSDSQSNTNTQPSQPSTNNFRGRKKFRMTIEFPTDPRFLTFSKIDEYHQKLMLSLRRAKMPKVDQLKGQTTEESRLNGTDKLKENKLSRNHRLADSSIKSILVMSGYNLLKETDAGKSEAMKNALKEFAKTVGEENGKNEMEKLITEIEEAKSQNRNPKPGVYQQAHDAISGSPKNIRIGDAERNQQADNAFDANRTKKGHITPKSGSITLATLKLVNTGAISEKLALATTTAAKRKKNQLPISSSTASDSTEKLRDSVQDEITRLQEDFRKKTAPTPGKSRPSVPGAQKRKRRWRDHFGIPKIKRPKAGKK